MKSALFIIILMFPIMLFSKMKTNIETNFMYYDYIGSEFYKNGNYESIKLDYKNEESTFTILFGNQKTNGKKGLFQIYNLDCFTEAIDSVYYNFPDSTVINNTTYTYESVVIDTFNYDIKDIIQNEIYFAYKRDLSKKFSSEIKFKYCWLQDSYLNSAIMIGSGNEYKFGNFVFHSDISFTFMNYDLAVEVLETIIDTVVFTTLIDTLFNPVPDSVVTTEVITMNTFLMETGKEKMSTFQFYNSAIYIKDRLLLNADFGIYKIFDSKIFDDDIRIYSSVTATYYWDYFGIFCGYSAGSKNLLQTFDNTYLNVSPDKFKSSGNAGVIIYPYYRNWSISYEYKFNEYEEKSSSYEISSHLLSLYYSF